MKHTQKAKIEEGIKDIEVHLSDSYTYQPIRTAVLDGKVDESFTQATIDKIVLWKVNRYSDISVEALRLLNELKDAETIPKEKVYDLFRLLLDPESKGFQIAMVSTLLRFRNPRLFQIMDKRVFRLLYSGETLEGVLNTYKSPVEQAQLYLEYLDLLHQVVDTYQLESFSTVDRVLYLYDKKVNADQTLDKPSSIHLLG